MITFAVILAASQAAYLPKVPNEPVTPCARVSTADPKKADEMIRRLKRQGFKVEVQRTAANGTKEKKTVSEGSVTFPISLSYGRVLANGC